MGWRGGGGGDVASKCGGESPGGESDTEEGVFCTAGDGVAWPLSPCLPSRLPPPRLAPCDDGEVSSIVFSSCDAAGGVPRIADGSAWRPPDEIIWPLEAPAATGGGGGGNGELDEVQSFAVEPVGGGVATAAAGGGEAIGAAGVAAAGTGTDTWSCCP